MEKEKQTQWTQRKRVQEAHRARCEADPVYQLLTDPTAPVEGPNGLTTFVDRLLAGCVELLRRRYGQELESSRYVKESHDRLCDPQTGPRIKQFALLFMLRREPAVADLFSRLYVEEGGGLHGNRSSERFQALLAALDQAAERVLNYPFGQGNVVGIVNGFVLHAARVYVLGME